MNEAGRERYGKGYIQEYPEGDHVFRGKSQPSAEDHKILRFHQDSGDASGKWHASIDEMQRKAQLRFNAAGHNNVSVAVQKFLDLPKPPNYSSEARFTPTIVEVEISRTVSGKQQVKVNDNDVGISYSNEKGVGDLFSWLKFKPGS